MPKDHLDKSMFFLNTVICKAKSSSLLKWILSDDNILLCSEWSLTSYNSKLGRFVKNIIDCSFVDKNKCRWILDFKFSTPKENESYESFVSHQIQVYEEQLNNYYNLITRIDKDVNKYVKETRMCLLFPLMDKKIEIKREI